MLLQRSRRGSSQWWGRRCRWTRRSSWRWWRGRSFWVLEVVLNRCQGRFRPTLRFGFWGRRGGWLRFIFCRCRRSGFHKLAFVRRFDQFGFCRFRGRFSAEHAFSSVFVPVPVEWCRLSRLVLILYQSSRFYSNYLLTWGSRELLYRGGGWFSFSDWFGVRLYFFS